MTKVRINLSKLSHKTFSRLVVNLLKDWEDSQLVSDDFILNQLKKRLEKELKLLLAGLAEVKDTAIRQEISLADQQRDLILQHLADSVKLGKYAQSREEKEAYRHLKPLVKGVYDAKRQNNEAESAFITNLLKQLSQPAYQQYLKSLQVTKLVTQLRQAQEAFEQLVYQMLDKRAKTPKFDNKMARRQLQKTYVRLADYLYILSEESPQPVYADLYKVFAANSAYFKPLTRKSHKTKTSPPVDPVTEENQRTMEPKESLD